MLENWNIPIYKALKQYHTSIKVPFHMPGHKLGKGFPEGYVRELAGLDLTEVWGCDNLHDPHGAIKEAQELASQAFGSDRTWFLVNGSSVGVHAMILTLCRPGDKLIVGRDCHCSAVHGMMLAGVKPVYVKPEYDRQFGIPSVLPPHRVEEALKNNPDAVGVLITRPNYYGVCSDVRRIAEIVHSYGKVLAVDEAHGAHLAFHPGLPEGALQSGADICVQSAHKTLPAFNQGAYLHVRSEKIDPGRVEFYLRLLQTTSPSYIILSSLDIAREIMVRQGRELLDRLLNGIESFRQAISEAGLAILTEKSFKQGDLDKTRIVVNFREIGMTGYEAERILRDEYRMQVEMSDIFNIVCITTVADGMEQLEALQRAVADISVKFKGRGVLADNGYEGIEVLPQKLDLSEVMNKEALKVPLSDAKGMVSRTMVTPYPPGIPLICPGELITGEAVEYLTRILRHGGVVQGIGENTEIQVVKASAG